MPPATHSDDSAAPIVHRTAWHEIGMGDYKARICVRQWLPASETGPILIAIHKLTGSGLDFEFIGERLAAAGWQVICPDLPGHGDSTQFNVQEAYSTGNMSRALATVFNIYARGGQSVSLLGTSWSGAAILLFLAAFRLPVRALIVNDIAFEYDPFLDHYNKSHRENWSRRFGSIEEARQVLMERSAGVFRQHDGDRIDPEVLRRNLDAQIARTPEGAYRFNYDANFVQPGRVLPNHYPNFTRVMASIRTNSILLMFGENSPFKNTATVQRLRRDDRRIEYVEIPGAGHSPRLLTEGEADIVRDFLQRQRAARQVSAP